MNDDVSVDCDAMDRVDELANLFRVDLENESLRIAKARAASNGEPVYVTLGDVNAAAAKMAADRAATKPLVDAACKWCECVDSYKAERARQGLEEGDPFPLNGPVAKAADAMAVAGFEMQDACLAVYEASKTKSEGEEKA